MTLEQGPYGLRMRKPRRRGLPPCEDLRQRFTQPDLLVQTRRVIGEHPPVDAEVKVVPRREVLVRVDLEAVVERASPSLRAGCCAVFAMPGADGEFTGKYRSTFGTAPAHAPLSTSELRIANCARCEIGFVTVHESFPST